MRPFRFRLKNRLALSDKPLTLGEEIDSCYGYIVADCEAFRDEEYKKLVSDWAGIKPEECTLEMIDGCSTHTTYNYRTA